MVYRHTARALMRPHHRFASRNGGIPGSQMSTEWRAGQNKTANSYVIEIYM
jgi:hypothetical protein